MAVTRDVYGFALAPLTESEQVARDAAVRAQRSQTKAFAGFSTGYISSDEKKRLSLKAVIRKGVPVDSRPALWYLLSGASVVKSLKPVGYYETLTTAEKGILHRELMYASDENLPAAFRQHNMFQRPDGLACLRRVMGALAQHNPELAQVKGLNIAVAFALIAMGREKEDDVFWTVAALWEQRILPSSKGEVALGTRVEQRVLQKLVEKKLPKVADQLDKLEASVASLTSGWISSMFVGCLPAETAARIWDAVACEGGKVMHRVVLALLKKYESTIMSCNHPTHLKKILEARMSRLYDADGFFQLAFKGVGSLSNAQLQQMRVTSLHEVEKELMEYRRKMEFFTCRTC